jgi:hypothetical protein
MAAAGRLPDAKALASLVRETGVTTIVVRLDSLLDGAVALAASPFPSGAGTGARADAERRTRLPRRRARGPGAPKLLGFGSQTRESPSGAVRLDQARAGDHPVASSHG